MAGTNSITTAVTDASFVNEVEESKGLVLVDFWASWCGPCLALGPTLEELATEYTGRLRVLKLNVDENQNTAFRFRVRSIPAVVFFKDGKPIDTVVGAYPKPVFVEKIAQHLK